ncbi:hypothetical protein EJ08DRAFT_700527 [Tothia fuscella]|uniref:Uncharacterized protein n=1 Tax=Tothia fuscella TaxID=1048955 RepID=A0A9P4NKF2_9PEZI|nr:hypothetical protein EJ08DRAFT_700527 [Tothia fuscella]
MSLMILSPLGIPRMKLSTLYAQVSKGWADQGCYDDCQAGKSAQCKAQCFDAATRGKKDLSKYGKTAYPIEDIESYSYSLYSTGKKSRTPGEFGINPLSNDSNLVLPTLAVCVTPENIKQDCFPCVCGNRLGGESLGLWRATSQVHLPNTEKLIRNCFKDLHMEDHGISFLVVNMCKLYFHVAWPSLDPQKTHGSPNHTHVLKGQNTDRHIRYKRFCDHVLKRINDSMG